MSTPYDSDLVKLFTDPLLTDPLLTDPLLNPAEPTTERSRIAAPYLGIRRLQSQLDDGRPLLADRARLRAVLELSAVTDPRLFHAMFLHHCMAVGNALDQGADDADVAELVSGRWIGAALMTELGHGSSSSAIRTEARYDPATREFVLHTPGPDAAKHPVNVGLAGIARLGVVSARLLVGGRDRGTALFLVALRDENGPCPGVVIEPCPRTSLLPLDYATVRFDQVRVPYRRWLGDGASITEDGSFHDPLAGPDARTRRSLGMSRFACGAVTAGLAAVARAGVALALPYATRRPTFDRLAGELPAIGHLNQQRLLFGALAAALAATAVAHRATERCWHIPPGGGRGIGPSAVVMRELALAKVTANLLADAAVNRCRSACGALGFFSQSRLIDYQALTLAFQSACGDNRLILLDAAWAMATGPDHLPPDDQPAADAWIRLFRTRERLLHTELTADLRAATAADGSISFDSISFDTWNENTELAQQLAEAHAARTTAEILHEEWHAPTAPEAARPLLHHLYQLHCLEQVTSHAAWYLAQGLLTAQEVLALPERSNEICRQLVHHTDALTGLLEIPDALLHGPLSTDTHPGAPVPPGSWNG
ncbi:acyl-CoA dehydrogenase [Kitasatospora kifunensis]|uniref:Acyl-CoA oxidase n=1 Tax=Kitasatospora kifunensis TaxID=58351 RepID=A0A7W7R9E8_KITKI|nr:acyl-CoA dehydrogenase [Kitasatospora kifunensis]MBB4927887.1 acyl-CoA oxidase [Kitasatospora kifunensis]